MSAFLSSDDLFVLTGRRQRRRQIDALRKMGVPFRVNAAGRPVVTWAAVNGQPQPNEKPRWSPPTP